MTKLVQLRSIEHGLRRALAILGDDGAGDAVEELIGVRRSASLLRKCADPDNDHHHLHLRYAVALDIGCAKAGHISPLLEVYQFLIEHHAKSDPDVWTGAEGKLLHAVLYLQTALGALSQTVSEGLHDKSPAGARLTNREKHAIHVALEAIDHQSEQIKRSLAN